MRTGCTLLSRNDLRLLAHDVHSKLEVECESVGERKGDGGRPIDLHIKSYRCLLIAYDMNFHFLQRKVSVLFGV